MKKTHTPNIPHSTQQSHKKIPKWIVHLFIVLTILMMLCGKLFSVYNWLEHPQFTINLSEKITDTSVTPAIWLTDHTTTFQLFIFRLFFVLDFIWAFLLFYIVGKYVHRITKAKNVIWIFRLFLILACIAYTFDCTENFYYLIHKNYEKWIVLTKIIAYSAAFLVALLVWIGYTMDNKLTIFRDFVSTSFISLLFLVIIGLTLPKAPQMNSIVVDLYYHPGWFVFVLLLFFAPIYCIVLSHYPTYFFISKSNRKFKDKNWHMSRLFAIFGIVWYSNDRKGNSPVNNPYENTIAFLRRVIGVFFYGALFYMIAYTADTNFDNDIKFAGLTPLLIVGLIYWLYVLKNKKSAWKDYYFGKEADDSDVVDLSRDETVCSNSKLTTKEKNTLQKDDCEDFVFDEKEKRKHNKPMYAYLLLFTLTIIAHVLFFIILVNATDKYSFANVVWSLLCIVLQAITYVYYRTYRTIFKYVFFNRNLKAIILSFSSIHDTNDTRSYTEKEEEIYTNYACRDYYGQTPLFRKLASLGLGILSNNVIFLAIIVVFGFLNAILLMFVNFIPEFSIKANTIVLILSYFFLFYGIIVIVYKHFVYYNLSKEEFAKKNKSKFFFTVYAIVLLLVILNFLARHLTQTANNLYEVARIDDVKPNFQKICGDTLISTPITLKTYVKNLPKKRYYIGCYGGGMKANAWTMTVLNALDQNNTLYDRTVCLSGASGGTIGLINYSVLKHEKDSLESVEERIRKIATENVLSMDVTHLLGRDLFLHLLWPGDIKGMDRSTSAMRLYARYANPRFTEEKFTNTTYREYWNEMYCKRNNRFPILISNSTNIKGRQGMAVSIKTEGIAQRKLYLGANDILELYNNKTLSFYNAVSTTNRFPFISPAATIETEGQYNDGGIFENSGLLSAYKLYTAIDEIDAEATDTETVFINIVNDKVPYIRAVMDEMMENCSDRIIHRDTEISAILNSVAATEMFPGYIKEKLQLIAENDTTFTFKTIYLPHTFSMDDVKALYGDEIANVHCVEDIHAKIESHNKEIKKHLKGTLLATNAIIEPAMSRIIAIPAFDYMEYMLEHDAVKNVIDSLK